MAMPKEGWSQGYDQGDNKKFDVQAIYAALNYLTDGSYLMESMDFSGKFNRHGAFYDDFE